MSSTSAVKAVEPSSAMMESPNWLDMPRELMVDILHRLRTGEVLKSARKVCRTWRTICNDPALWKVIDIKIWKDGCDSEYDLVKLVKQAVDLSSGELTDVSIKGYCTDDLLHYIVQRSSKLKCLSIRNCHDITARGLRRGVKRLPELEKLHIDCISIKRFKPEDTEAIGRNCPQLKSYMASYWEPCPQFPEGDDHAVAVAKSMPNLRHLKISGDEMTNVGLQAILNGCHHLEYLDIYMRCRFILDGNLVNKCMERIKSFIHNSPQDSDDF